MAAGFLSRCSCFKHTDSLGMKKKYYDTVKIRKLKEVVRNESKRKCLPVTLSMESYLPLEGYVEVRLRENIKEVTDIDPQTETSVTMFEYDEYTFLLKNREGLQEDIENNLSDWLITGRTLEVNESASIVQDMKAALEILEVNR